MDYLFTFYFLILYVFALLQAFNENTKVHQ